MFYCDFQMFQVSNMKLLITCWILLPLVYGNTDSANNYDTHLVDHQIKHEAHDAILKEILHAQEHEIKIIPHEAHLSPIITTIGKHLVHKPETEKDKLKSLRWHSKVNKATKKEANEQLHQKKNQNKLSKQHLKSHERHDMANALIKHIEVAPKQSKGSQLSNHHIRKQMSDEPVQYKQLNGVPKNGKFNKKIDNPSRKSTNRNKKLLRSLNTSKKNFHNKSTTGNDVKTEASMKSNSRAHEVVSQDNHAVVGLKKLDVEPDTSGKRMAGDKKHVTHKLSTNVGRGGSRSSRNHHHL